LGFSRYKESKNIKREKRNNSNVISTQLHSCEKPNTTPLPQSKQDICLLFNFINYADSKNNSDHTFSLQLKYNWRDPAIELKR